MNDDEVHAHLVTTEQMEPLDNGLPGFRLTGLADVHGTFAGTLDEGVSALFKDTDATMLYFYGPDPDLPWWKHWFYRLRQKVGGGDYPTVVLASGPAKMTFKEGVDDGDDVVFEGEFTSAGHWDFK